MTSQMVGGPGEPSDSQASFQAELASLRPLLYQRALFLTGNNKTAADDLVHDAVQRALEWRDRFSPGANLLAWSSFVMRNLFIDAMRHMAVQRTAEREEGAISIDRIADPDDLIEFPSIVANDNGGPVRSSTPIGPLDVLSYEDIFAVASTLRPSHREVFALAYQDRLPHRDIAERLGIPRSTVDTRLRRVRLALRDRLHQIYLERLRSTMCRPK